MRECTSHSDNGHSGILTSKWLCVREGCAFEAEAAVETINGVQRIVVGWGGKLKRMLSPEEYEQLPDTATEALQRYHSESIDQISRHLTEETRRSRRAIAHHEQRLRCLASTGKDYGHGALGGQ